VIPGALLLSAFAPAAVTPLLMLGGAYLCFEATEKILEALMPHEHGDATTQLAQSSAAMEAQKVAGAIRTDLILSAEIMAIALASVADRPLAIQAGALALVGFFLTVAVYGVVGFIVKMDDIGVHMASRPRASVRSLGRGLVRAMPPLLATLSFVGTAAMLWVGGGILVHGLEHFHLDTVPALIESAASKAAAAPGIGTVAHWLVFAAGSAVLGLGVGGVGVAATKFFVAMANVRR